MSQPQARASPGYRTRLEQVLVKGASPLLVRALFDHQQFYDPCGLAQSLGISSAIWPLFGQIWPSGAMLASKMAARPVCHNEKILEIGCGLALASLVAHRRGARITASDTHPLAGRFLQDNVRLNQLQHLPYKHGQWGDATTLPERLEARTLTDTYDLIIGSDLLYERDTPLQLAEFIHRHAAPQAEVWVVDPDRGHRPAFNRKMAAHGFILKHEKKLPRRLQLYPGVEQDYKGRMMVYRRSAASTVPGAGAIR